MNRVETIFMITAALPPSAPDYLTHSQPASIGTSMVTERVLPKHGT
jgi:hypothetical protein